jgi:amidase
MKVVADFRTLINEYLESLVESPVRSLKELIDFNKKNAEQELPPDHPQQDKLARAQDFYIKPEDYQKSLAYIKRMSKEEGIDKTLAQYDIDVIIGPADSFLSSLAAAAGENLAPISSFPRLMGIGYPIATVPIGRMDFNGRPFGLLALTTAHREAKLLHFMSA